MAEVRLTMKFQDGSNLIWSHSEFVQQFMHGISLCTKDGQAMSSAVIEEYIRTAQTQIENLLMIKLNMQPIVEQRDFIRGDYQEWGFIKCSYPIRQVCSLLGFINKIRQIEYPVNWVSQFNTSEEKLLLRNLHIVPAGTQAPVTNSVVYSGITPHLGFAGMTNIPNYWTIRYMTGFIRVPEDIRMAVGKLAAIQVLAVVGDVILGIGVSSQSLSIDGLSQSVSTNQSAGSSVFAARINQYTKELVTDLKSLIGFYKGLSMNAM